MSRLREEDARKRKESSRSADFSEALARGINIIRAFGPDKPQMTMSDVARAVNLPRATARRAMYTLQQLGFLESDGRLFRLTPKVLELASSYLMSNMVSMVLQPICDRISRITGEACSTAVLQGSEVVMIAHASPRRLIAVGPGVGFRLPAHCTSLGRVLLAALPDVELDTFLAHTSLSPTTPYTLTDKAVLRMKLQEIKQHGFALVDQEAEVGFRSIAVPITRYDGTVVAAINVGARIEAATEQALIESYLPLLRRETKDLYKQMVT